MEGQPGKEGAPAQPAQPSSRLVKTLKRADHRRSHSLALPFSSSNPHTPSSSNPTSSRASPDTFAAPMIGQHEGPIKATHGHPSRSHNRSQSFTFDSNMRLQPSSPALLTESDVKEYERLSMDSDADAFDDSLSRGSKKRKGSSSTLGSPSEMEEATRPSSCHTLPKPRKAKHRRAASYQLPRNNSPGQFHSISELSAAELPVPERMVSNIIGSTPVRTIPVRPNSSSRTRDLEAALKPTQPPPAPSSAHNASDEPTEVPQPASEEPRPNQYRIIAPPQPPQRSSVNLQLPAGVRGQATPTRQGRHSRNLSAPVLPVNRMMAGSPITQISSQFAQTSFNNTSPGGPNNSANSNPSPMSLSAPNSGNLHGQANPQQQQPPRSHQQQTSQMPSQPTHGMPPVMPAFLDPFSMFTMHQAHMMLMSQFQQQFAQQPQQQQPPPQQQQPPPQQPQASHNAAALPVNLVPLVYQSLETQARNLGLGPQEARQSALNVLAQVQPQLGGAGPLGMPLPHSSLAAHRPGPVQTRPLSPQLSQRGKSDSAPSKKESHSNGSGDNTDSSVPKEAKLLLNLARNSSPTKAEGQPGLLSTHATPSSVKRQPSGRPATPPNALREITEDEGDAEGKRFKCDECGKRFHQSSNLITHRRIHTGERPYECTQCHKRFSQSSNLRRHMMTHTGEKPFECEICHKKCSRKGSLVTHMRIHTGEKPFECSDCGKKFSIRGSLTMHARIHTGERPFQCNDCGKSFPRRSELTRHMKAHERQRRRDGQGDAKTQQQSIPLRLPGVNTALATLRLGALSEK